MNTISLSDRVGNLEDLQLVIEKALMVCGQHPSLVSIDAEVKLEKETLSDRSIVYNLIIKLT